MIEVEISRRDWLHGATIWCAEVTTTGNGGWKIGKPERCGFSSYAAPGDPHGLFNQAADVDAAKAGKSEDEKEPS